MSDLSVRTFASEEEYLTGQVALTKQKLAGNELGSVDDRVELLAGLLIPATRWIAKDGTVLCLGARRGEEVVVFRRLGFWSEGIDLVAHPPLVRQGNFHALPYEAYSWDAVYSNSFDHSNQPIRFAQNVIRVLKPSGVAILHLGISIWSQEVVSVFHTPEAAAACFKPMTVLLSETIPPCLGGMNHLLVLEKPSC